MIAPTIISNFDEIVKKMIFKSEGDPIRQPRNVGDHTVTYGYGYTFIRKNSEGVWSIYGNLKTDLLSIGISFDPLFEQAEDMLRNIVFALNNGGDLKKTVDPLIVKFCQEWKSRYVDLTDAEAQQLYETEIQRCKDVILSRFEKFLGNADGQTLYNGLQNSREMVSLLSLACNAQTLIGEKLTKAMWEGNRAEAWFEIRYNSNNGKESRCLGLAKRRFLEAQIFGLYDNPASVGSTEAQQIFKMLQTHRWKIAEEEKEYGISFNGTPGTARDIHDRTGLQAAQGDYAGLLSYVQSNTIQDLLSAFQPAKAALFEYLYGRPELPNVLITKLTDDNIASTNIYLNPHKDTDPKTWCHKNLVSGLEL